MTQAGAPGGVGREGSLAAKAARLREILRELPGAIVALSGGVDSSLVAAVSAEVLADRALAVTGVSDSLPEREREAARAFAAAVGIRHEELSTHEIDRPRYVENSPQRCFECKDELYGLVIALSQRERGDWVVLDGANLDDAGDFRPGRQAAALHGVRSPLAEAGFTKADVRALAREMRLAVWDKPAMACLASRVPYGQEVTPEKLRQIGAAEAALQDLGFRELRVRHHGEVARLEIGAGELSRAFEEPLRREIVQAVKGAGFGYVALDLEGFRSGSMNEVLPLEVVTAPVGRAV